MLGMPVEWNAVATSPQLTCVVGISPCPKSQDASSAQSRVTMRPLRRRRVPAAIASIIVLAVPRDISLPRKIKFEVVGIRQSALQVPCKAVGWHDVKADSGWQHNAACRSLGVPRGEGLEDVNFAGDVEVVNAIAETGIG